MKHVLIILTFVSWLTPSALCFAADPGEELFFSLKANLWYQGIDPIKNTPQTQLKMGERNSQHPENKENSSSDALPEELTVALKNL